MAEYFRDEQGKDVLLFKDNIFRFTQAGSEVSALLGRMPSAAGYQPTLSTEMGELQERITSQEASGELKPGSVSLEHLVNQAKARKDATRVETEEHETEKHKTQFM